MLIPASANCPAYRMDRQCIPRAEWRVEEPSGRMSLADGLVEGVKAESHQWVNSDGHEVEGVVCR